MWLRWYSASHYFECEIFLLNEATVVIIRKRGVAEPSKNKSEYFVMDLDSAFSVFEISKFFTAR